MGGGTTPSPSPGAGTPTRLRLQPLVHVDDMPAAVAFYQRLGGAVLQGSPDGDWVLLDVGGTELGLLAHPPNPEQGDDAVELTFVTDTPLQDVEAALRLAGVTIRGAVTPAVFGSQLQVVSPDGLLVKINRFGA